jgi:hypothetical protein
MNIQYKSSTINKEKQMLELSERSLMFAENMEIMLQLFTEKFNKFK